MFRVRIIKTGGTIAKSYDEFDGALRINRPVIERLIAELRLPDLMSAGAACCPRIRSI